MTLALRCHASLLSCVEVLLLQFMTFKLLLNAKIILNSKFSIIYLFFRTRKERAHLKARI
jgi:hypothetical protein